MTFLKVLLIILLVFWLISLIRVGGRVRYGEAGLFVFVLAGPLKIQLFPSKPKAEKPKKKKKPKKEKKPKEKKPKPEGQPGTLSRLMKLDLIWGGSDPAAVAIGYGQANAALGMLWPVFDNNFKVKHHSFQIGMDYGLTQPAVELEAAVTFTIGQIVTLGVHYGVKALIIWVRSGRPVKKRQEAMIHE